MTESKAEAKERAQHEPAGTPIGGRPPWSASPEEVAEFVQRVGKPYDLANADYEDPGPFARDVRAGKNTAIYNAHSYHTKVPPQGIIPYLEHYTRPGDLVLDPFCGSGMIGVACLMAGRHCILNDLSPAATHIAYNYVMPVNVGELRREFNSVRARLAHEFEWLYRTKCEAGHDAKMHYAIWSDTFECPSCRAEIVLWDAAVDPQAGVVRDTFACRACGRSRLKKSQLRRRGSVPVRVNYECLGPCRPRRGERDVTSGDRDLLQEIDRREIPYWFPRVPFGQEREMWRGGHRDARIQEVADFFTKRNLRALAALRAAISECEDTRLERALMFLFTGITQRSSKTARFLPKNYFRGGGGPVGTSLSGTMYVPAISIEVSVEQQLDNRLEKYARALKELGNVLPGQTSLITCHAGQFLSIGDSIVDYVFTDPPFGSNIFYADCNLLWEAWLGYLTSEESEAVWNRSSRTAGTGKGLDDYKRLMAESFAEMHRVLKPGRWASVVFHNSDDRVWHAIREAVEEAGFSIVNALAFDKQQRTFKGIKGEKGEENVTNFDIVLNLQKASVRRPPTTMQVGTRAAEGAQPQEGQLSEDLEEFVVGAIQQHLSSLPVVPLEQESKPEGTPVRERRTTQFIHSLVMKRLVAEGRPVTNVTYSAVASLLPELFKQVDGRWYLPGDEIRTGRLGLDVVDEASAIEWIRNIIRTEGPQVYGDLAPRFRIASVHVKLSKSLDELLQENFQFDERRNRWRLPTASELERKREVVQRARARRVRRFLDGLGDGPRDPAGLADWVEWCHQLGLYPEAQQLFNRIIRGDISEERYRKLLRLSRVWAMQATGTGAGETQIEMQVGDKGTSQRT